MGDYANGVGNTRGMGDYASVGNTRVMGDANGVGNIIFQIDTLALWVIH